MRKLSVRKMVFLFRGLSFIEGMSYLMILCVSFGIISREYVFILGITHGVLFMLYSVFSLVVSHKFSWPVWTWLLIFLAAIIPGAFILVELFIRKELRRLNSNQIELQAAT